MFMILYVAFMKVSIIGVLHDRPYSGEINQSAVGNDVL